MRRKPSSLRNGSSRRESSPRPAIYPAVRYGEAIVRTSYMATHTEQDLDNVLEVFTKLARELGTFDDPAYAQPGKRKANVFDFRLDDGRR